MPYSEAAANRAISFFERVLVHCDGEWAGQPFILLPWQRDMIGTLFGTLREDGLRQYRTCYCEIPRKNGKALALDTPIPTPTGWATMGSLVVGDLVFDEKGHPCRVVGVTEVQEDRPCYAVTFSDGCTIVADAEHEWITSARVNSVNQRKQRKMRRYREPNLQIQRHDGQEYYYAQLYRRQVYLGLVTDSTIQERFKELAEADLAQYPVGQDTLTRIRTTYELHQTCYYGKRNDRNHSVQACAPLRLPDANLPIEPYVLGVWLGDGHTASNTVTCSYSDTQILDEIKALGVTVWERKSSNANSGAFLIGGMDLSTTCRRGHGRKEHTSPSGSCRECASLLDRAKRHNKPIPPLTIVSLRERLREIGVLGNKHIPASYLRGSVQQRLSLLQGLMDTDGYVSSTSQCEFTSTNVRLAHDAQELVHSLGFKSRLAEGRACLNGKDCGPKYRLRFHADTAVPVFRLDRKSERQRTIKDTARSRTRQIVSVTPVASVPVRCIQVNSDSQMYLAGLSMIPTHNSQLAAGVALYLLFADKEPGAQVYGAASDRDQASIVFRVAKEMTEHSPTLLKKAKVIDSTKRIVVMSTASFYRAIPADAGGSHGFNASGVIVDEVHVQPNRDLIDVLNTSTGARRQPLTFYITTAGFDKHSICYELHDYALKVRAGIIDDPTFLPVVYAADEQDDWTHPATWAKCNPSLGVTPKLDYLERECARAKETPAYENTFRRLHLSQWTAQETRWLPVEKWDACATDVDPENLRGRTCYAGLDLSSTTDISALVLLFPDGDSYDLLPFFWLPADSARKRGREDRVPYETWASQGYIDLTPGNVIDYAYIRAKLNSLAEEYNIVELGYDPWNATQLVIELQDDGFSVVPVRQGFASLSAPTKELEKLILGKRLRHNGNPVMRWMVDSVSVKVDSAGNLKPDKATSRERIDGVIATIVAVDRATRSQGPSCYESQDILVFG